VPRAGVDTVRISLSGAERRRSPRIDLNVPVAIDWKGARHEANTASVNEFGALIRVPFTCRSGSVLAVRNLKTGRSVRARVVWAWFGNDDRTSRFNLGVEFVERQADFWGAEYGRLAAVTETAEARS